MCRTRSCRVASFPCPRLPIRRPARQDLSAVLAIGVVFGALAAPDWAIGATQPRLDQARNGTSASPTSPVQFQNGNAGSSNSHYLEGQSIPYRLVIENLPSGPHVVVLGWDIRNSGKHAIDYITHYDRLRPHTQFMPFHPTEIVDPLAGLPGSFGTPSTFAIPPPSSAGSPSAGQPTASFGTLPAEERVLTMYNGTIASVSYDSQGSLTAAQSETRLRITFTSNGSDVVLAWGGHIASRTDWGPGNSAANINGSPYHTRVIELDGSGGNQDRSLNVQAAAVLVPPSCDIQGVDQACEGVTKVFTAITNGTAPTFSWSVTGSGTIVGSSTGSTVSVRAGAAGSYTVSVTIATSGVSSTCEHIVVITPPTCLITGPQAVCPASSRTFSAPDGMASYRWTVTGSGTIVGSDAASSVAVEAGSACIGGAFTVGLTTTDADGCTQTCSQPVSITDTTPPEITCPADVVVECGQSTEPANTGSATATDDCGANITITFNDALRLVSGAPRDAARLASGAPSSECAGAAIERTWTARDACGNTTTCVQRIGFVDTTPPVITCPADLSVECGQSTDPTSTGSATATDNCGANITITFNDALRLVSGGPGDAALLASGVQTGGCAGGGIERTWTARDACGNTSTCVQQIGFVDTTPPVITCPPDVAVECGQSTDPTSTGSASATDNCGGNITITFNDALRLVSGGPGGAARLASGVQTGGCTGGGIERTWTARDVCGNTSTCVQQIGFVDTTPPVITCPADLSVECGQSTDPTSTGSASATDNCGGNITITFNDALRLVSGGPGDAARLASGVQTGGCAGGGIERTWTARDVCGNTSTCVQQIGFVDTTPPVITCPADVAVECGQSTDPTSTGSASATDNCGGNITITFNDALRLVSGGPGDAARQASGAPGDAARLVSGVQNGECAGTPIERTWTARDACGNTSTCVQQIGFVDTTPPVITCPPDVVLECGESTDPTNTGTPSSTDNCGTNITITFNDALRLVSGAPSGGCSGEGLERTWTARDACGNTSTCVQTIEFGELPCPRTAGFWTAQCAQNPSGRTKFDAQQVAAIAHRADDKVAIFTWPGSQDFTGFCTAVVNHGGMNQRLQAKRQFATFLANNAVGELGFVANNGDVIGLGVSTPVSCSGFTPTTVGALIGEVDARLVTLESRSLQDAGVTSQYEEIIGCLDAINNGRAFPVCASAVTDRVAYGDLEVADVDDKSGAAFARPSPNPFLHATRMAFLVPADGQHIHVGVYDIAGREIRRLADGEAGAGWLELIWNGRDDRGERVNGGVYFVHAVVGSVKRSVRVVYLKP